MVFVELIKAMAQRKNATPAQVALAWLLARKPFIVPIPGTTKENRLIENLGASQLELTAEDLQLIEAGAANLKPAGERYSETHAKLIDR